MEPHVRERTGTSGSRRRTADRHAVLTPLSRGRVDQNEAPTFEHRVLRVVKSVSNI